MKEHSHMKRTIVLVLLAIAALAGCAVVPAYGPPGPGVYVPPPTVVVRPYYAPYYPRYAPYYPRPYYRPYGYGYPRAHW
jgi:hypothetical protein